LSLYSTGGKGGIVVVEGVGGIVVDEGGIVVVEGVGGIVPTSLGVRKTSTRTVTIPATNSRQPTTIAPIINFSFILSIVDIIFLKWKFTGPGVRSLTVDSSSWALLART